MIRIRPAEEKDNTRIKELNRAFNGVDAVFRLVPRSDERVLVAETEGVIGGFACVRVLR